MIDQAKCFATTMWEQFFDMNNPLEYGEITRLWTKLRGREILWQRMLEYFKLAYLCQTMILEIVEDD